MAQQPCQIVHINIRGGTGIKASQMGFAAPYEIWHLLMSSFTFYFGLLNPHFKSEELRLSGMDWSRKVVPGKLNSL